MSRWARLKKQGATLLLALGWLYGGLLIIYFLGRLLIGEQWSLIEVGNSLMPSLLFPMFFFLLVALLLRRWRLVLVGIPALLIFTGLYLPFFLPRVTAMPEDATPLRVLTFNIGSRIEDEARLVATIRSADADIVALQELLTAPAALLTEALSDLYPYHALHPTDAFARGVGIFSRLPIRSSDYLDALILGGQRVEIAYSATESITIFNVHPIPPRVLGGFDSSRRQEEIESVLDSAEQETAPLLLVGDFNITDQTDDYAQIAARYQDAFRLSGTGLGFTFPNLARFTRGLPLIPPLIRIDYVFFGADWVALDAYVLPDHGGSDHYPVLATLALTGTN